MKRAIILFACLLGISGLFLLRGGPKVELGSNADISTSKETATSSVNRAHDALWRASERERAQALARTLGSEPCGTMVRTFFQGLAKSDGLAMWNVQCSDGHAYSLSVHGDGSGSVLDCRTLKAASKVDCFVKLD